MKKVLILIGILALTLSLVACGNADVSEADEINNTSENVATNETEATNEVVENDSEAVETSTSDEEELAVGKRIPNYELTTLEGETVSLHDYDGKIILLNFWATW